MRETAERRVRCHDALREQTIARDELLIRHHALNQRSASVRAVNTGPPRSTASSAGLPPGFTTIAMGESGKADASAVRNARTSVIESEDTVSVLSSNR